MTSPHLLIGSYACEPGQASFKIDKNVVRGQRGVSAYLDETWHVHGRVTGTSQSDISSKIVALETAVLDIPSSSMDVAFMLDASTPSAHKLTGATAINGIQTGKLEWLTGDYGDGLASGAQYVLKRSFRLVLTARTLRDGTGNGLWAYSQTIKQRGNGGPRVVMVGSLTGTQDDQETMQFTKYLIMQSGFNIGATGYISADTPILPARLINEQAEASTVSPQMFGLNHSAGFMTSWHYTMQTSL